MIDGTDGNFGDEYGGSFNEDHGENWRRGDGAHDYAASQGYPENDIPVEGDGYVAPEFVNEELSPADEAERVENAMAAEEQTRAAFREIWVADYTDTYRLISSEQESIVAAYDRSASQIKDKLDVREVYLHDPDQMFGYAIGASLTAQVMAELPPEAETWVVEDLMSNLRAAVAHIIAEAGGINHPLYAEYEKEDPLDDVFKSITHQHVLNRLTGEFLKENGVSPDDSPGRIEAIEDAATSVKSLLGIYDVDLSLSTQSYSLMSSIAIHTNIAEELARRGLPPARIAIGTRTASAHLLNKNMPTS